MSAGLSNNPSELLEAIRNNNRAALGRGITLIESLNEEKRALGLELLDLAMPFSGNSRRVGITGVPGVGKSTFIESLGVHLIDQDLKPAILAIDPTSLRTGGSILGDKTRMERLASDERAFIRPSPAGKTLGGVAARTRESILLCEAAGFDVIIVETVGVGQSETSVHSMVDFFLLLMLSGAGDDLQGIKRGIMEMADLLMINKADSGNETKAKKAAVQYKQALHLFPPRSNGWVTDCLTCSAIEDQGIDTGWHVVERFFKEQSDYVKSNREEQNLHWFKEAFHELMTAHMDKIAEESWSNSNLLSEVRNGKVSPFSAAQTLFKSIGNA